MDSQLNADAVKNYVWIFGSAVQDITVDVDLDRLAREYLTLPEQLRLDETFGIKPGVRLSTQIGLNSFTVPMRFEEFSDDVSFCELKGGNKYSLTDRIKPSKKISSDQISIPCENISWGGGGINVATFLRTLAPNSEVVPVRYSDIAMSKSLRKLIDRLDGVEEEFSKRDDLLKKDSERAGENDHFSGAPWLAEEFSSEIAKIGADYAPERSMEGYLASLQIECVMYRPKAPHFRRNWIFSRIKRLNRRIENKIICRGRVEPLASDNKDRIAALFEGRTENVGVILLNSIKEEALFCAAYNLYKDVHRQNPENTVAVLAMTEGMLPFTKFLIEDANENKTPPLVFVFNETEFFKFAQTLDPRAATQDFMKSGKPNMKEFARLACIITDKLLRGTTSLRLYVTLGSHGSLGVDEYGNVVHVASYAKQDAVIFDTNACGDAYCAAITLLEWAKRNGFPDPAEVGMDPAREMEYFMAVATAAAYSKATNRRGRVYATDVRDLLEHLHLAKYIHPARRDLLAKMEKGSKLPPNIDEEFGLMVPEEASQTRITDTLNRIMNFRREGTVG